MMLQGLFWLSNVLDVPLPLTGGYLARAIGNFDHQMLHCPGLPTVMDMIERILPTREEINLLHDIPYASEMGDPESWVVAVGKIRTAGEKVKSMRRTAWDMHAVEMGGSKPLVG